MNVDHVTDRDALVAAIAAGTRVTWLFFLGHTPPTDEHVLGRWRPAPFGISGAPYETAGHWRMAERARLFGDHDAEKAAIDAKHPAEANTVGRRVPRFDNRTASAGSRELELRETDTTSRGHLIVDRMGAG